MTRYTFILSALAMLLGYCVLVSGIDGFNEYTRITRGQAIVDTAVARGWISPIKYKPTMKITTEKQ